jgi:hypothetical protein
MIFVFTGPTLPPDEARQILEATYLPPVSQGDVYRASLHRPVAIGIIDGYFDQVPSVWHKEILWAMQQGILVFGSSSMGALRAAELASFGMIGVGRIFNAFLSGELEDDDEVAIEHGPPESGYRRFTEAMVNIRETLAVAEKHGVIGSATSELLVGLAKSLHYQERDYGAIIAMARSQRACNDELERLENWLPTGRIDQKRLDAIAMLDSMRVAIETKTETPVVEYHFENTTLWSELRRSAGQLAFQAESPDEMLPREALLDELRLSSRSWKSTVLCGFARTLATREMRRRGLSISDSQLCDEIVAFRRERGLLEGEDLQVWMKNNHLSQGAFLRLLEKEKEVTVIEELVKTEIASDVVEYARIQGWYPELARRAIAKRPIFEAIDAQPPTPATYELALAWFAKTRKRPPRTLTEEAQILGFENIDHLIRAVLGEYLYCQGNTHDASA